MTDARAKFDRDRNVPYELEDWKAAFRAELMGGDGS